MILFRERPGRPVPKAFPIRIPNVRKGLRDADCVSVRAGAFPLGGSVPSAYRIRLGPGTCFVRIRRRVILAGMGAVRKYTAGSASWAGADTVCRTVAGRYAVRCVYDMPVLSRFPGRCVYDAAVLSGCVRPDNTGDGPGCSVGTPCGKARGIEPPIPVGRGVFRTDADAFAEFGGGESVPYGGQDRPYDLFQPFPPPNKLLIVRKIRIFVSK